MSHPFTNTCCYSSFAIDEETFLRTRLGLPPSQRDREIKEHHARRVLEVVDAGLIGGSVGQPRPGAMCVNAAISYALGMQHSDHPVCVGQYETQVSISLNDFFAGTYSERSQIMRRLAIAQLGTADRYIAHFPNSLLSEARLLRNRINSKFNLDYSLQRFDLNRVFEEMLVNNSKIITSIGRYAHEAGVIIAMMLYASESSEPVRMAYLAVYAEFCEAVVRAHMRCGSPGVQYLWLCNPSLVLPEELSVTVPDPAVKDPVVLGDETGTTAASAKPALATAT